MDRFVRRLLLPALGATVLGTAMPGAAAAADRSPSAIVPGEPVHRTSVALTATYDVRATVSWSDRSIRTRTEIDVTNTSGGPIDRIELNTVAGPLGDMELLGTRIDGVPAEAIVDEQTITVPLGGILPEGEAVQLVVRYRATLGTQTNGLRWIFAKADGMLAAYRWIPWISRKRSWHNVAVGDPYFTPVSPHVRVTLTSDRQLTWVTNGRRVAVEGRSHTFVAERVRDFNFTAAPDFGRTVGRSGDGQTKILVYTRSVGAARRQDLLVWARRAFDAFEERIGRYPYPTYVISEAPGPTGLESPGLTWIGRDEIGTGNARYLAIHETGHQWFYGVVGNDQPRQPFADEAVVEFLTRWHLGAFRGSRCATTRLDGSAYSYVAGCYYEVVYVQGSRFLETIREDIGNGRFWDALHAYWKAHRFRIGSTLALLEALRSAGQDAGVNLRSRYRERFPSLY